MIDGQERDDPAEAAAPRGPAADPAAAAAREREAQLIRRARDGQAEAWGRLYHDNYDRLLRDLTYLVGDVAIAEDLVQESFVRALTCLARYDERSSFAGWIRGIGLNLIRQHWRSGSRRRRALDRLQQIHERIAPPRYADPEGSDLQRRRAEALHAVLDTLPGHLREAFVFTDIRRLPSSEAAELLGISAGNLRIRATRARARIHRELTRLGWFPEEEAPR